MPAKKVFTEWNDDFDRAYFTPEEIAIGNFKVAIVNEMIKARKEQGITQQKLEEITGIKQPAIARIESGRMMPQIETALKILLALGKTLVVAPIEQPRTPAPAPTSAPRSISISR